MTFNSFNPIGPPITPPILKYLIGTIIVFSLGATLVGTLIGNTFLHSLFALSAEGIKSGFIFQFITYAFLQTPDFHLNLSYLIHLAFSLYILWVVGAQIIQRIGNKSFILFFFLSILTTGLVAFLAMDLLGQSQTLSGTTALLYSLLIAWIMLYPDVRIFLFFILPILAKHLVIGILGINLIIDLVNHSYLSVITYLTATVFGYLYSLFIWKCKSPFIFLHPFEKRVFHFSFRKKAKSFHPSKVYDIKTGEPILDDEQFLDAMLSKISLYGKDTLTSKEKKENGYYRKEKKKLILF